VLFVDLLEGGCVVSLCEVKLDNLRLDLFSSFLSGSFDLFSDSFEFGESARDKHDIEALFSEVNGGGLADAISASSDDSPGAFAVALHGAFGSEA
jgi:hypothetical protein